MIIRVVAERFNDGVFRVLPWLGCVPCCCHIAWMLGIFLHRSHERLCGVEVAAAETLSGLGCQSMRMSDVQHAHIGSPSSAGANPEACD